MDDGGTATDRTLDLYGPRSRQLYRPRWAAAGCWMLVITFLSGILGRGIIVTKLILPGGAPPPWITIQIISAVYLVGFAVGAIGMIAILVGDVTRGGIAAWPRWGLAVLTWICWGLNSAADAWYLSLGDFRTRSIVTVNSFQKISGPLIVVTGILYAVVLVFALVYALQLARWLGNKPLAWASALIFGALFLGGAADAGLRFFGWLQRFPSSPNGMMLALRGITAWQMMAESCLIALLVVLAVRLGRAARRG